MSPEQPSSNFEAEMQEYIFLTPEVVATRGAVAMQFSVVEELVTEVTTLQTSVGARDAYLYGLNEENLAAQLQTPEAQELLEEIWAEDATQQPLLGPIHEAIKARRAPDPHSAEAFFKAGVAVEQSVASQMFKEDTNIGDVVFDDKVLSYDDERENSRYNVYFYRIDAEGNVYADLRVSRLLKVLNAKPEELSPQAADPILRAVHEQLMVATEYLRAAKAAGGEFPA